MNAVGVLGMRLHVGLFSSTIQLSLLLRWPHLAKKTTKYGQSDNAVSPVRIQGAHLHRDS